MKGFLAGTAIGSVVVFLLWGGVALAGGLDLGGAGAVGVFTTAWGGPGFGGMLGAVIGYVRYEERLEQERPGRTEARIIRRGRTGACTHDPVGRAGPEAPSTSSDLAAGHQLGADDKPAA